MSKETMADLFDKASQAERERKRRPLCRARWENVARRVWSGEEDVSALEGCPLPVGLLDALQVYEALSREYDQGDTTEPSKRSG